MIKILLYIGLSVSGFAFDSAELGLALNCKGRNNCTPAAREFLDKAQLSCEIEVQGLKCQELEAKHPEWTPMMRRCDIESLCKQNEEMMKGKSLACLRGYKNAMVDLGISIKDMTVSLAQFVDESWEGFKNSIQKRNEFIRECNKSLACKRDLVKDDHRYRDLPDEKLNKLPASFLYVQAQEMRSFQASMDRYRPKPKPVPSEAERQASQEETLRLSAEHQEKLKRLMGMVGDQVKTQYNRYACYGPLAQEELKCYAIGTIIDPTLVAGYFVKGARAATAIGRLAKTENASAKAVKYGGATFRNRTELVQRYLEFSPTTVAQNEKWISLAEKGKGTKATFFDVENSQIKVLNDTLKDKNLVTGLTNFHKDILAKKMEVFQAQNPGLEIEKYSDFKSMRFAFSGKVPPDLEKQLQKLFKETNQEFDEYLRKNNIVRDSDRSQEWFRGGLGETADQANLAARYSRQVTQNNLQAFSRSDLQTNMNQKLMAVEKDRQALRSAFANTSVVDGTTLHPDAFDIVRKGKGDTQVIASELSNRFGLSSVPPQSIEVLQRYAKATDDFSPGLFIAKRENAHLNDAVQGGLSADIIGLGSANLKGTAEALASSSSVEKALEATRVAEKAVTENFVQQKKVFEEVVRKAVPSGKLKTLCSGDDCVSVATAPLNEKEKVQILKGLAGTKYSGNYRLAFIPDGIKDVDARNGLANHGEAIEKILRKSLSSSMEPNKLKGLTFGVDMRTQNLNSGSVKLLMGEADGVRLSATERKTIEARFKDAVEALNKDLASKYSP